MILITILVAKRWRKNVNTEPKRLSEFYEALESNSHLFTLERIISIAASAKLEISF